MSKLLNTSSRFSRAHSLIHQTRGLSLLGAAGVLIALTLGGCGPEDREKWTWNPFEKKSKATAPDAGTKARRPAPPAPPATASNTPNNNAKPTTDDQKAEQVNRDVGNYASTFPPNNNTAKPREADPRTPAIDDDRALADASSSSPRAQRTSARPSPTPSASPQAPSPTTPSDGMSEELVLIPTGSNTSSQSPSSGGNVVDIHGGSNTGNSAQPPSTTPDSTAIVMTYDGDNRQPTHSNPDPAESTNAAAPEDDAAKNDRPPVLGSVAIEAGTESGTDAPADDGSMKDVEINDTTKITPTPIRPIDMDKPANPTSPTPVKPSSTEIAPPINSTPPPAPKKIIEESKPAPTPDSSEVKPFEDREDTPPPVKPQPVKSEPVKSEPVKPAPIEPKPEDITKPANPPANVTPPTPTPAPIANEVNRPIDTPARQIADMEAIVARQPNNIDQQLKLRMRYLEQGDEFRAVQPTPGMSEDVERTVIAQIKSVIAAKSSDGRAAPEAANKQLVSAETIRAGAVAKADLMVPRVALCTAIRAFGDYTPIEPPTFPAGRNNRVLVYIEVENFMSKQMDDGQYKTILSLRESLLDARGRELWSQQNPPVEDINRQRRRDFFLTTGERPISPKLPPGEYFYKVEVEDLQASKVNSAKTQFKLVAVGKN